MSITLTDGQRAMLNAASMREDRCLTPAPTLRRAQISRTREKLIEAGLVREVKAKLSSPVWRRDDRTASDFALKLTAAGAKAIATEDQGAGRHPVQEKLVTSANPGPQSDPTASSPDAHASDRETASHRTEPTRPKAAPRSSSKIAAVIGMLDQEIGATIGEIASAMGWLPHSTRAALTGLRKRGYVLSIDRSNRERGSVYRIETTPEAPAALAEEPISEAA